MKLHLLRSLILSTILTGLACSGCSHQPLLTQKSSPCANLDWFEIGRTDGAQGLGDAKLAEHQKRCNSTRDLVNADLYENGRNAGLVDYCTPAVGMESGRNGLAYDGVCPEHLEKPFLMSYDVGRKLHDLDSENAELASRISTLSRLLSPSSANESVRSQIEQLKSRRSQLDATINQLEGAQ